MSNDLVSPVNRIEMTSTSQASSAQPAQTYPADNNSQVQANTAAQQTAAQQTQAQNKAKAHTDSKAAEPQPESKAVINSTNKSDVHMMFRVDAKTKEVSVLMVDKVTKKVVRTIPPDEIRKMNAGDLVELLA